MNYRGVGWGGAVVGGFGVKQALRDPKKSKRKVQGVPQSHPASNVVKHIFAGSV